MSQGFTASGNGFDMLSTLTTAETAITAAGTATISRMHRVLDNVGVTTYDITLPAVAGNTGKMIGFIGDVPANLTKAIRVVPASGLVGGAVWKMVYAGKAFVLECDGTNWNVIAENESKLAVNTTIALANTMSVTTINQWFAYAPKNLNTFTLTYQFADGTYTVGSNIQVFGFLNGTLNIFGNRGEANADTQHSTQGVILDATAGTALCPLFISSCACIIYLYDIRINTADPANGTCLSIYNTLYVYVWYNCFTASGTTNALLCSIRFGSYAQMGNIYFDKGHAALFSGDGSELWSILNYTLANNATHGLACSASHIYKYNATQPATGEETACGGVIA